MTEPAVLQSVAEMLVVLKGVVEQLNVLQVKIESVIANNYCGSLTSTVPPVSCLCRNTECLANLVTEDGITFLAFLDWMQLRAADTLDAHHWLNIGSVVVKVV